MRRSLASVLFMAFLWTVGVIGVAAILSSLWVLIAELLTR